MSEEQKEIEVPPKTLDAAYGEMLYRQDRLYYETRATLTDEVAIAALDVVFENLKAQMQACTTVEGLDVLEQTAWIP
jgi:hypothetical protein